MTLWDNDHGIDVNNTVRVEVPGREMDGLVDLLEGTVTEVAGHKGYLSAYEWFDLVLSQP